MKSFGTSAVALAASKTTPEGGGVSARAATAQVAKARSKAVKPKFVFVMGSLVMASGRQRSSLPVLRPETPQGVNSSRDPGARLVTDGQVVRNRLPTCSKC